jgi:putative heme-binding domain-containing protein
VTPPAAWKDLYTKLSKSADPAVRDAADELGLKFGDERVIVVLLFQATHPHGAARRSRAVEQLAPLKRPEFGINIVLRKLLADPEVRGAAVRGLSYHPDPETPAAILKAYPAFTAAEKADAIQTLASRKEFADKLLDALEAGTVPKADVTAFAARQILALNDKAVSAKLTTVWGTVKPASATRAAQTARLKALLAPENVKAADLANGRALYTRSCAACHKLFGEGGDVGPELTGSQRANLDYILENVLDPNAVVPFDYKMTAFALADGRVVTGLVKKETPQAVTVRTVNEAVVIPVADIETRKPTPHSVMPEGLLDALKDDEVRDLIAYLAAKDQVPLKKN